VERVGDVGALDAQRKRVRGSTAEVALLGLVVALGERVDKGDETVSAPASRKSSQLIQDFSTVSCNSAAGTL
jgi:hypothetical protein